MRESYIKYIENQSNKIFFPRIGKNETYILDNLEECFGYTILRQYKIAGYFIDGYCPALRLAIEIDESRHNEPEQLQKDIYREEQIKNELGCSFLRISDYK